MTSVISNLLYFNLLDNKNNIKKYISIPSQKQGVIPITPLSSFQINNDNIQFNGNLKLDSKNADDGLVFTCDEDGIGKWETGGPTGPASSIINNIVKFADTTGKLLSDSGIQFPAIAGVNGDSLTLLDTTVGTTEWAAASGGGGGVFEISGTGANPYSVDIADSGKIAFLTGTAASSQEIILPDISVFPASDALTFTFKVAADYDGSSRLIYSFPGSSAPTSGILIGSVKWDSPVFSSDTNGFLIDGASSNSVAYFDRAKNAIGVRSGDTAISADESIAIAPAADTTDGDYLEVSSFGGKWYISGGSWLSNSIEFKPNVCAEYSKTQDFSSILSPTAASDKFGTALSISGPLAAIGATGRDVTGQEGAVYIFEQIGGTWTEVARCMASDGAHSDFLGTDVAIQGDWMIGGALYENSGGADSGAAYLYQRNAITRVWPTSETQKLVADDASAADYFGSSVAIDGDYIGVGASDAGPAAQGAIYVFKNTAGTWAQTQKLEPSDGSMGDKFGGSQGTSMSGTWLIAGALANDSEGSAYIFERTAGTYSETQEITGSLVASNDYYGSSVSIDGDWAVVGAPGDDVKAATAGAAYVWKNTGGTWAEETILYASDPAAASEFGFSVSISGDQIVIGAKYDDTVASNAGAAYIFSKDCGGSESWGQVNILRGIAASDYFGSAVANSWSSVLVSAPYYDQPVSNAGRVYAYTRN